MGFRKLKSLILGLFFHHLLCHLAAHPPALKNGPITGSDHQQNVTEEWLQEKLSAVGGGVGGGSSVGEGTHGNGNSNDIPNSQGGAVIPLYAAGDDNHHENNHRHGANTATSNYGGLSFLVLTTLIFLW